MLLHKVGLLRMRAQNDGLRVLEALAVRLFLELNR
jgi:hypothetical protein